MFFMKNKPFLIILFSSIILIALMFTILRILLSEHWVKHLGILRIFNVLKYIMGFPKKVSI